jgi:hypothetical protein
MPIVHVLTTSDLMRPIRIPTSAGRGAERPTMGSCIRCPIRRLCCRPSLQEPPRWSPGPQMEAKQNTLAQAGVRRNRLKNNTTRLSSAPDQAICNCWHKRTLAGYLRQCGSNHKSIAQGLEPGGFGGSGGTTKKLNSCANLRSGCITSPLPPLQVQAHCPP